MSASGDDEKPAILGTKAEAMEPKAEAQAVVVPKVDDSWSTKVHQEKCGLHAFGAKGGGRIM